MLRSRRSFLAGCAVLPRLRAGLPEAAQEYAERRRRLAEAVGGGVIALLGHDEAGGRSGFTGFRQESNFYYLTGHQEPGAVVLIAPRRGALPYRETLFLPRRGSHESLWNGPAQEPPGAEALAFDDVRDRDGAQRALGTLLKERGSAHGLRPAAGDGSRHSFERWWDEAGERDVRDVRGPLAAMRSVKSASEIELLQAAVDATAAAHRAAWSAVRPGVTERAVVAELVGAAFRAGCERLAFEPIAGSGANATILHYTRNRDTMRDGQLLLVDAGGEYQRYAGDLARTVPVGGRFGDRQRRMYDAVLAAQRAAVAAARPGATLSGRGRDSLAAVAERVLRQRAPRGVATHLPHALGHHVGLDVHDPSPAQKALRKGMVVAIEPGLYAPREGLGVRIEDMVEITDDGCRVMSAGLPSSPEGVEEALAAARAG